MSSDRPETTGWRRFRERATGRIFRARWVPDTLLPEDGGWEEEGVDGLTHAYYADAMWEESANG